MTGFREEQEWSNAMIRDLLAEDEPPACDDCGEHHEGYGECPMAGAEGSHDG